MKPTRIYCPRCGRYPYAVMSAGIEIVEFDQASIGADAVLAEAVRSAADAVLNAAAKEQGQ